MSEKITDSDILNLWINSTERINEKQQLNDKFQQIITIMSIKGIYSEIVDKVSLYRRKKIVLNYISRSRGDIERILKDNYVPKVIIDNIDIEFNNIMNYCGYIFDAKDNRYYFIDLIRFCINNLLTKLNRDKTIRDYINLILDCYFPHVLLNKPKEWYKTIDYITIDEKIKITIQNRLNTEYIEKIEQRTINILNKSKKEFDKIYLKEEKYLDKKWYLEKLKEN